MNAIEKNLARARNEKSKSSFDWVELQETRDRLKATPVEGFGDHASVTVTLEKCADYQGDQRKPGHDAFLADPETGLIGVADGTGRGHAYLASRCVAENLPEEFKIAGTHMRESGLDADTLIKRLDKQMRMDETEAERTLREFAQIDPTIVLKAFQLLMSIQFIHRKIQLFEPVSPNPEDAKPKEPVQPSTTFNGGVIHRTKDGRTFYIGANAGDSIACIERADGRMEKITQEDSLLDLACKQGMISPELLQQMKAEPKKRFNLVLTAEFLKAMGFPENVVATFAGKTKPQSYRELLSAFYNGLGDSNTPRPSLVITELHPGDRLFLATDGFGDMFAKNSGELDEDALKNALEGKTDIERLDHVREAANNRTAENKDSDDKAGVLYSLLPLELDLEEVEDGPVRAAA